MWLGGERGYLTDYATQQWVKATGRFVNLQDSKWLDGPVGNTRGIGADCFDGYATQNSLTAVTSGIRGLIPTFDDLQISGSVQREVRDFYERTSDYDLDAWAEWRGTFRPFGSALARFFSRRLQQLNVPLSAMDSRLGMTSKVVSLTNSGGEHIQTLWIRHLVATGNVLYAGSYSVCRIPGYAAPCIKVVFPLPNGSAIVLMKPVLHENGSLSVVSAGENFGDPGFYFTVHDHRGSIWARYVRSLREAIHVYESEDGTARADHALQIWGMEFLRLHYRMRARTGGSLLEQAKTRGPHF
jgi:hypothetical protein